MSCGFSLIMILSWLCSGLETAAFLENCQICLLYNPVAFTLNYSHFKPMVEVSPLYEQDLYTNRAWSWEDGKAQTSQVGH